MLTVHQFKYRVFDDIQNGVYDTQIELNSSEYRLIETE
jgi:hypothetical protein